MITTDAIPDFKNQTNKKRKRIQKQKQRAMIECKTFVFKPTNNGVVNFSYKLMFDEEMMREADEQFAIMKSENASLNVNVKNESVKKVKKSERESITRPLDREGEGKREVQSPLVSNLESIAEMIQNVKESDTTHNPDVVVCEEKQLIMRKPSIPKRRHVRTLMPTTLSPIPEETEKELALAAQEKWFFEEFCEGFMPPSEDLDDWSLPSESDTVKKAKIDNVNTASSKPKLPFRVEVDEKGRKSYVMTDEVRQKLMASPQYKEHIKRKQQMMEATKAKPAETIEDEKAPMYAENMAKFEEKLKKAAKDGSSSHLSSAGAIEIPVKKLVKVKDTKSDVGITFTSSKPEKDHVEVDSEIRVSKRIAGKIDFNQFKRPRRN